MSEILVPTKPVRGLDLNFIEQGKPINPQTDEELLMLTELFFGIRFARKNVCPDHVAPAQAFCDAFFARSPFMVCFASRGLGGKSVFLATLTQMEFLAGMTVVTLGGSAQQSKRVLEAMERGWNYSNRYEMEDAIYEVQAPRWAVAGQTAYETRGIWTNWIKALAASETSVRGEHPIRLNLDEIDAMDLKTYNSAQGMPLDGPEGQMGTVASSTRQNSEGTMDYAMDYAKEHGFPIAEWCYRENMVENGGWITEDQLARKKASVPPLVWEMEYENQEPFSQGRVFSTATLKSYFVLEEVDDIEGEELIFEEFDTSGDYVTAADWGKDKDYTVITTWRYDVEFPRIVAWIKVHKEPWPRMIERFNSRCEAYPGKYIHDSTGLGKVIVDLIEVEDCIHYNIGGQTRTQLLNNYIGAVENSVLQVPLIRSMYKDHRNLTSEVFKGGEHMPDSVCSCALAASVITQTSALGVKKTKRPGRPLRIRRF